MIHLLKVKYTVIICRYVYLYSLTNTLDQLFIEIQSRFKKNGVSCTRKQFPIVLGWAISTHRSQEITLDKALVSIGNNEFAAGLTYVALSRVKTSDGLLLKPAINFNRLLLINNSKSMVERRGELERPRNLANNN